MGPEGEEIIMDPIEVFLVVLVLVSWAAVWVLWLIERIARRRWHRESVQQALKSWMERRQGQ